MGLLSITERLKDNISLESSKVSDLCITDLMIKESFHLKDCFITIMMSFDVVSFENRLSFNNELNKIV